MMWCDRGDRYFDSFVQSICQGVGETPSFSYPNPNPFYLSKRIHDRSGNWKSPHTFRIRIRIPPNERTKCPHLSPLSSTSRSLMQSLTSPQALTPSLTMQANFRRKFSSTSASLNARLRLLLLCQRCTGYLAFATILFFSFSYIKRFSSSQARFTLLITVDLSSWLQARQRIWSDTCGVWWCICIYGGKKISSYPKKY